MTEEPLADRIPFAVEVSRMIELLAAQIYPSPFALLRENVQNSFDAILLRRSRTESFDPEIVVTLEPNRISVSDNGIGMSREDLRQHFWRAGSSSKNTPEARAAGVVGTFGIGAMANFGVAEELTVVTESLSAQERTWCRANRGTLSVTEDCIEFRRERTTGQPGTQVIATIQPGHSISVKEARTYIADFVRHLPIRVLLNGELASQHPFGSAVPEIPQPTWEHSASSAEVGNGLRADITLAAAISGDFRIEMSNIILDGQAVQGSMILRQDGGPLRTFRSLFGLATASVPSAFQLGGVADFPFFEPTAGREALTTGSMQTLQRMVSAVDDFVGRQLAARPESNVNTHFARWVVKGGDYALCGNLRVRVEPGHSATLNEIRAQSRQAPVLVYSGADQSLISHASEERKLVVVSRSGPRHTCELTYLRQFCSIEELSDAPKILESKRLEDCSIAESALAFRVASILSTDYFLPAEVRFGTVSHGLPVLVTKRSQPVEIYLDPNGQTVRMLLSVFEAEYGAFGHLATDFVRNVIFPKVADLVPSSTRQGAEAFLKAVQRGREVFEYETADLENLTALWSDYLGGKITMRQAEAGGLRVSRSYLVLDIRATAPVRDIMPDVIQNEAQIPPEEATTEAAPPIKRLDIETERKLLTIPDDEAPLRGYRCFLAITDRTREEKGEFFLQAHRTSVVWGGQRALFIFEHHSGRLGLYYDIQAAVPISDTSGGGTFETCTIVMKNRVFIPVPDAIRMRFVPVGSERKRLEVRCDVLPIERLES